MSYPNVIYGDYGDEKVTSVTKIGSLPLGKLMILPDGRKFRFAQAGTATDLEPGALVSPSAGAEGHGGVAGSGLLASVTTTYNLAGDTTVRLLAKSTAFTKDQYEGGFMNVQSPAGSTEIGHVYKIKSNKSCASVLELEVELAERDGLKVAFKAATTMVTFRRSPFKEQIIFADGTAPVSGITPVAVTKSYYFWVQTSGVCSAQVSATTITDGYPVIADTATAGSVTMAGTGAVSTTIWTTQVIGYCLQDGAAQSGTLIDLKLE